MVFFAILLLDADSSCMYFFVEWLCYVNYTIELVKVLCIARFDGMRKNLRIPYLTCVFFTHSCYRPEGGEWLLASVCFSAPPILHFAHFCVKKVTKVIFQPSKNRGFQERGGSSLRVMHERG